MKNALKIDDQRVVPGRIIRVINKAKPGVKDNDEVVNHIDEMLHFVWVEDADGKNERPLAFTNQMLKCAEALAQQNKEDIPKKGLIQDLID